MKTKIRFRFREGYVEIGNSDPNRRLRPDLIKCISDLNVRPTCVKKGIYEVIYKKYT